MNSMQMPVLPLCEESIGFNSYKDTNSYICKKEVQQPSRRMSQIIDFLDDSITIQLLKILSEGKGVDVNISAISGLLGKHRNTIGSKFNQLIEHKIIDLPFHPFPGLFTVYPLLVLERITLPRDVKTNTWIEKDPYIWAAFFVKDEEYNTLLIELHKDLYSFQQWKERIVSERQITIPKDQEYIPSEAIYLSSKSILKYDPCASIDVFRKNFEDNKHTRINELELDSTLIDLLEVLMRGQGVKSNPNDLARRLGHHRRTIQRRMNLLLDEKIIWPPVCRFPRIWAPPGYFLVISLVEIRRNKKRITNVLEKNPHVSMMIKANTGRYNLVTFTSFYRVEDFLAWEESLDQRFSKSIGAVRNIYLSPSMAFSIQQQYVSLAYLESRLARLHGQELKTGMAATQ